jgi:hypothetical protein
MKKIILIIISFCFVVFAAHPSFDTLYINKAVKHKNKGSNHITYVKLCDSTIDTTGIEYDTATDYVHFPSDIHLDVSGLPMITISSTGGIHCKDSTAPDNGLIIYTRETGQGDDDSINYELTHGFFRSSALDSNVFTGQITAKGDIKLNAETASRACYLDANKMVKSSAGVTATELEYLDATSSIQTQLNNKVDTVAAVSAACSLFDATTFRATGTAYVIKSNHCCIIHFPDLYGTLSGGDVWVKLPEGVLPDPMSVIAQSPVIIKANSIFSIGMIILGTWPDQPYLRMGDANKLTAGTGGIAQTEIMYIY